MKSKVRFKGKLRSYLCWPLWLTIPMTLADVGLYFYDVTAGFLLTVFIAIYFVLELGLYYNTRPRDYQFCHTVCNGTEKTFE